MKNKMIHALQLLFALEIILSLILGGTAALGFFMALLVGGTFADTICQFLKSGLIPLLYAIGASTTFVGLLKMYLNGEKSFVMDRFEWKKKP